MGLVWRSNIDSSPWDLVTALSQVRVGEGRFFRSSASSPNPSQYQRVLRDAELELLTSPSSPLHLRIRALIHASVGNLSAAGDSLRQLLEYYPDDAEALNDLGVVYMAQGKEKASNYFRAAHLFERSRSLTLHAPVPNLNAALVYKKLELHELSNDAESEPELLDPLRKALSREDVELGAQLLQENLPAYRQVALDSLLNPNNDTNADQSAETYFTVAKTSGGQIESIRERELSDLNINLLCARIRSDSGKLSEAENCLQRNMKMLGYLPGTVPYFFVQTLLQLGETHALQGQFTQTRQNLQEAADVLESDDAYLAAGGLRMSFENEWRSFYEKAIAFEYDHGGRDKAWEYTQRYRSKLFLEFLGQLNPGVASVRGVAIDRNRVQQLIPPNVRIVEYVVLQDRLLIWLVSNNSFVSATVPVTRAQLERKIGDFLKQTQDKGQNKFQRQAQDLHRLLIEPIESQLDPGDTLAIIPDQDLHRLNFPALYSVSKKSYLIERYAMMENPSLTSLLSDAATKPSRDNAIAFGAQADDTNATVELTSLQKYYSRIQTFNGPAALKTAFLTSLESAEMLHFAGHSQDASDPLRSAILLDGKTKGVNSVTALDITRRRMPPNSVVVLASCDSSVGNSRDGIGMRGLTSAFLISGAGSVVGSLWLVEAGSTSRLVLGFHKSFALDKLPVAEALRKAQLKFIAEGIHPYYWSGFVVTGNLSALR